MTLENFLALTKLLFGCSYDEVNMSLAISERIK